MSHTIPRRRAHCALLAMGLALPLLAWSQDWKPERTVDFIVPAGPGAALPAPAAGATA